MTSTLAYLLGALFPIFMIVTFVIGIRQSDLSEGKKQRLSNILILSVSLWTILMWSLAAIGVFEYQEGDIAPRFLISLIVPVAIGLFLFKSSTYKTILEYTPQYMVVGIQTLRILGISFLIMAMDGSGPQALASAGYGDLVTGVLALLGGVMLLLGSNNAKWVVWAFNFAGLFDLLNVSRILLTYYPSWYNLEPSTAVAAQFPTVLVLCIAAPIALLFHIYSIRFLLKSKNELYEFVKS